MTDEERWRGTEKPGLGLRLRVRLGRGLRARLRVRVGLGAGLRAIRANACGRHDGFAFGGIMSKIKLFALSTAVSTCVVLLLLYSHRSEPRVVPVRVNESGSVFVSGADFAAGCRPA